MKREREDEMKSQRGAPQIAFIDLSSMSRTGSILYILGIIGFFLLIFYILSTKLFNKPVDFNKKKRDERQ
jgi:hypothetical protein